MYLISLVTRGMLDGDLNDPRNTIIVTTEDEPGDSLKPRLIAAGADLSRVSMFQMGSRKDPLPFYIPKNAEQLGRRVREVNAALIVVDPLVEFIDGKLDSHKSAPVRQAVATLNVIARETGCAVLVVFHLNKGVSTDPLLRHEASAAFTQIVRGSLLLGNDPNDPDGVDGAQRVLATTSSNLAERAPSLSYSISARTVTGDTGETIRTAVIEHTGEPDANGPDLLAQHREDGGKRTLVKEAVKFLESCLAEGPKPATDVEAAALAAGIAKRTLKRAKEKRGIQSSKTGFAGGAWVWGLPREPGDDGPLGDDADGPLGQTPVTTGKQATTSTKGANHYGVAPFTKLIPIRDLNRRRARVLGTVKGPSTTLLHHAFPLLAAVPPVQCRRRRRCP